jgi:hypothetical protein
MALRAIKEASMYYLPWALLATHILSLMIELIILAR